MRALYRILLLVAAGLLLSGCFWRIFTPAPEPTPGPGPSVGETIEYWASWVGGLAGLALCLLPVATVLASTLGLGAGGLILKRYTGPIALGLVGTAITAGIVAWLGHHLWLVSVVMLCLGLLAAALWAWKNRGRIEAATGIDVDRDGEIG